MVSRTLSGPGWWLESVATQGHVTVIAGWQGSGEVMGQLVQLYDTSGNFLVGTTTFWRAGDMIDARIHVAGQTADAEEQMPDRAFFSNGGVTFLCGNAGGCGNVDSFRVLVVIASDSASATGFGIFADQATLGLGRSGLDQGIASTRSFDGATATVTVSDAVARTIVGVHAASGATKTLQVDDSLAAVLATASPSATMSVPSQSTSACKPCIVPRGAAGQHVFRYDDVDTSGREGFLIWADVPLT